MSRSGLLSRIQQLGTEEQIQLLDELTVMVRNKVARKKHSIMELRGLGKEIWRGIDAQKYVHVERESWSK